MGIESDKALILGGGGVLAIAWETGLFAGLAEKGVDLLDADLIAGTSAGSVIAAQLTGSKTPHQLYRDQVEGTGAPEPVLDVNIQELLGTILAAITGPDPVEGRREVGRMALERDRVPEAERRRIIEVRLADHEWPDKPLAITAVRADTGEFTIFTRESGVDLVDAVAASCAIPMVWPAVTIDGVRYYDAGMRSAACEDVAVGYGRVIVVKPLTLPTSSDIAPFGPESEVLFIEPDPGAIGENILDPSQRPASAEAGYQQGLRIADQIREFWTA